MNILKFKKRLTSLTIGVVAITSANFALASGAGPAPEPVQDVHNSLSALQSGAKTFVNYCLNCHAASSLRYSKLESLGLSKELIEQNLLFTQSKVTDMMTVAMDHKDAKKWFGAAPPDLSSIARSRSPEWLYSYLRNFYVDPAREMGWNNRYFENVGMPNPLWELQGLTEPVYKKLDDPHHPGKQHEVLTGVKVTTPGKQTPEEFEKTVTDLVGYLKWMGEPTYHQRISVGVWVLLFLFVLAACAWGLNKAYWKDIH